MSLQTLEENVNSNINEKIKQNNARAITGIILNGVLRNIISFVVAALGLFYTKEDINDKLEKIELTPGEKGDTGAQGIQGEKGDTGEQGFQGMPGMDGAKGDTGEQGLPGMQGEKGDTGEQGLQGLPGMQGDKGDTGEQGFQGLPGMDGAKGDTGDQGLPGMQGEKGDTGEQGLQGLPGMDGLQGEQGYSAYIVVPDVSLQTAANYDEPTMAYFAAGKVYFGITYKYFVIRQIGGVKRFIPLGITFIGTDDNGINVFDPVTEQYILIRTWESMKGLSGEKGKSAFEEWQSIAGNETKTLNDFWIFQANIGGFAYNLSLETDTSILFSSPRALTVTLLTLTNAASVTYSLNGGAASVINPGSLALTIAANVIVKFTIVYTSGKTQAIITISGNY